jgi:DNA-binding winged helix-turn-helix (wHTH) protein
VKHIQFQFGPFRLDPANHLLLRESTPVPLSPKAFDTLAYLVQESARLVTREELMKAIWPDSFVEDANLTVNISLLRKALGEMENGQPYIETVPRKGYRFKAVVHTIEAEPFGVVLPAPVALERSDLGSVKAGGPERGREIKPTLQLADSAGERSLGLGAVARRVPMPNVVSFPEAGEEVGPGAIRVSPVTGDDIPKRWTAGGQAASPGSAAVPEPRPKSWWLVASACLVVAAITAGWVLLRHPVRVEPLIQRRLTSFAPEMAVSAAAISTGAKFIAYANPSGLFVQVIATGDAQTLALPAPRFRVSSVSWFPDSARLLVDGSVPGDAIPSMWIVPVIGTGRPVRLGPYPPGVLSPDGAQIAWVNRRDAAPEIQLMESAGGPVHTVVTGAIREAFGDVSWGTNGHRLFFTRYFWNPQFRGNSGSIDCYYTRSGKTTTVLSGHDFGGDVISLPGERLVYSELLDATNGSEILSVQTDRQTGLATGSPWLIANWDAPVTGFTVDGSGTQLTFRDLVVGDSTYVGEVQRRGESLIDIHRLSFGIGREDFPRAWSPDGRGVFLDSNRTGNWEIFKQTLDSDSDQPFVQSSDDQFSPCVSPGGAFLLYVDRPRKWGETEPASIMRVPISGGVPAVVLKASGFSDWGLRFDCPRVAGLPCVLAQRHGNQIIFRTFSPRNGFQNGSEELARADYVTHSRVDWSMAPNGQSLAWIRMRSNDDRIHVVLLARTVTGLITRGKERDLAITGGGYLHAIAWSPDGTGWYVIRQFPQSWTLLYVNPEGKDFPLLTVPNAFPTDVFPSPDGRHLAFSERSFTSNVWLLRHF